MSIALLKFLDQPWERARGYLREDLDSIESSFNQRWAATFGDGNSLPLTTGVTGILPIANGGTGFAAYATGDLLYAPGPTALGRMPIGAVNTMLWSNGTLPSWTGSPVLSTRLLIGTLGPIRSDTPLEIVRAGGKSGILLLDSTSPGATIATSETFITFYGYNSTPAIKQVGSIEAGWGSTTAGAEWSVIGWHPNKANEVPDNSYMAGGGHGAVMFAPTNSTAYLPGDKILAIYGTLQIVDTNGSYRLLVGDLDASHNSDGVYVQGTNDGSVGGLVTFSRSQVNATPDNITEFIKLQHNNNTAKAGFLAVGATSDFHILTTLATAGSAYDLTKARLSILSAGQVGITQSAPTARLHVGAGAAGAGLAPFKLTSGTNQTTAEAGALEYNGTNLFFTRSGTTRENVLVAVDNASAPSTTAGVAIVNYYGSSDANFLGTPTRWLSVNILGSVYRIPLYV